MRGFVPGFITGVVTLYVSMCFHIVLANDGYHMVPKTALTFKDTYVDIRQFNVLEWRNHVPLAEAMMQNNKHDVIRESGQSAVQNALENLWDRQTR